MSQPVQGRVFLQREIDRNRRAEGWLVVKAIIALAAVGALVLVRVVYFS
jgi:hypothetical protein